jgi:AcrR family transcriptional regulator
MDAAPVSSLRERKKARLRLEMTRAAVALFRAQGFEATTVEQIVAGVEASPRTFFRYFGTKEDVLFGDTPDRLESLRQALDAAPPEDSPIDVLKCALSDQIASFTIYDDPALEEACAQLWMSEPAPRRRYIEIVLEWENVITGYLARAWRLPAASVAVRLTAMALIAAVRVSLEQGPGGRRAAQRALADGFAMLDRGFRDAGEAAHTGRPRRAAGVTPS